LECAGIDAADDKEGLMYRSLLLAALVSGAFSISYAHAEVSLTGFFIDHEACPALQSIRKQTNPGGVQTQPRHFYPIIAKNKPAASHYLIEIDGADPSRRWVSVQCGEHVVPADGSDGGDGPGERPAYVLAISWQPAFCEGKPDKVECKTETPERFDATHFTLHGLWPQPRSNAYCNVPPELTLDDKNGDWGKLPAPNLSETTREKLAQIMPGTQSNLERHEWIKHGTCFHADSADEYFSKAIALMDQLNSSKAQELFASHVGIEIESKAIRDAFDESFGDGAGDRVRIACKRDGGRNLIVEITVGLVGEIGDAPSLPQLIAASEPTDPGCPRGVVDAVGQQ
jgi:ribonuclease T2